MHTCEVYTAEGWAINLIFMSVAILASHCHKNKMIVVKPLLWCISQHVGGLICIQWNPGSSQDSTGCVCTPEQLRCMSHQLCFWSRAQCSSARKVGSDRGGPNVIKELKHDGMI